MKIKIVAAFAIAAAAAGMLMAGCEKVEQQTDVAPEHTEHSARADIETSLKAYTATHGLAKEDIREGLVIPWTLQKAESPYSLRHGFLVATGKTGGEGCPVFKVVTYSGRGNAQHRYDVNMAICP